MALSRLLKVTPAVYPHSNDFTGKLIIAIKVDPLNLESQNRAKNIPVGPSCFPNGNLKLIGPGVSKLRSDKKQTDRQTEIKTLHMYI